MNRSKLWQRGAKRALREFYSFAWCGRGILRFLLVEQTALKQSIKASLSLGLLSLLLIPAVTTDSAAQDAGGPGNTSQSAELDNRLYSTLLANGLYTTRIGEVSDVSAGGQGAGGGGGEGPSIHTAPPRVSTSWFYQGRPLPVQTNFAASLTVTQQTPTVSSLKTNLPAGSGVQGVRPAGTGISQPAGGRSVAPKP